MAECGRIGLWKPLMVRRDRGPGGAAKARRTNKSLRAASRVARTRLWTRSAPNPEGRALPFDGQAQGLDGDPRL
jgi:hypothetical protein